MERSARSGARSARCRAAKSRRLKAEAVTAVVDEARAALIILALWLIALPWLLPAITIGD
jgi:hypothetical protein